MTPRFWLEIHGGPGGPVTVDLEEGDLVVGRSPRCSITLSDSRIAPTHCGLRVRRDQVILAPGGTVTETWVNGQRARQAQLLRVGDAVSLGPYRMFLRAQVDAHERLLRPGDVIGGCQVVSELGAGAVGRVYEARHPNGRTVAVKILRVRDDWSSRVRDHRRALFRREARALAEIEHPNVVRSYGSGEQDGIPWLAMEFLEGITLREKMSAGRLPVEQIERLMFQLGAGVAAVHAAGVIHRDLKPSNVILVGADERAVLADFGLAQPRGMPQLEELEPADDVAIVRVGQQIGTPAYMPPEQTRGEDADMRSDVWSLGAMLYELAAGRRAFGGTDVRTVLTAVVNDCPLELPDDVAPHIRGVVYRCLQKARTRRFPNAVRLMEALHDRQVVQHLPCGAEGPPRPPLRACPFCGAPLEHPFRCPRCEKVLFRFTDGQVLTVPGPAGETLLACGTCGAAVRLGDDHCPSCEAAFHDDPPRGLTRSAARLTTGGTTVVSIFDRALELLENCPYCHTPRHADTLSCPKCGFAARAYVCGRVNLDLAVGGWTITCTHCGTLLDGPDEVHCPSCGLNIASGMFLDGTRHEDHLPAALQRLLDAGATEGS